MLLFYVNQIPQTHTFELPEIEAKHLRVIRPQIGQTLHLTDGKGNVLETSILEITKRQISLQKIHQQFIEKPYSHRIHLAIAPTKNTDRIEWLVEKCTEIGVDKITFLMTKHSERKYFKTDRVHKKAIAALKQSLKFWLPEITELTDFQDFIKNNTAQNKFMAYVDFDNPIHLAKVALPAQSYCLLIGPEGDFSETELKTALASDFQKVSLGKSRLRTETAGVVGCHILNLINE